MNNISNNSNNLVAQINHTKNDEIIDEPRIFLSKKNNVEEVEQSERLVLDGNCDERSKKISPSSRSLLSTSMNYINSSNSSCGNNKFKNGEINNGVLEAVAASSTDSGVCRGQNSVESKSSSELPQHWEARTDNLGNFYI